MNREETLREIQKRIAIARGYRKVQVYVGPQGPALQGTLHADEGPALVPRWPMDWCDAGVLVEEMQVAGECAGVSMQHFKRPQPADAPPAFARMYLWNNLPAEAYGHSKEEAWARCWCAWKGIDLSDIP